MRTTSWLLAAALAIGALVAPHAQAGRSCEERKLSLQSLTRGLDLAQKTQEVLEASGAKVVVLARAGQDLSKYKLHYSHFGFAYRQVDAQGRPVWRVVHKLNQCATADAAVYRQGLGEFFLDDPWRYEAAWVVLSPDVQAKLLPVLQDDARAAALHHKPYSVVSYVWGQRYQQSNQWAIETMAAAMQPSVAPTRATAQAWLRANGYQPSTLVIDPLTRLGGRMTAANVAFDDHPPEKRFSDRIETVTVDSVFDWLRVSGLGGTVQVIAQD
jgi:hypothetical protein